MRISIDSARGSGGAGKVAGRFLLGFSLLFAAPALASPFEVPPGLRTQVEFWKRVFTEWSEHQVVLHDNLYLDKIYGIVDVRPLAESGASDDVLYRERRRRTEEEKRRIDSLLAALHAKQGSPERMTPEERRIYDLFRDVPGTQKFLEARSRVRAQQGLRERFARGLEVSRRYLPHMEAIFREEGLPVELTRLPLVESTFNLKAYSKAGAAGIWQFIPSSARIYGLAMNEVVDERRDPLAATRAAARHLRDDYAVLGDWALAVTAYNHGRAGVARAVREVGSSDLVTIIRRYRGPSFGFASRNFYASFLAALEVDKNPQAHFGPLAFEPRLDFQEFVVRDYVPFGTLARLAGMDAERFYELNPGFERVVVDGKLYVPRGYRIRVPSERADSFRLAYANLGPGERFASQRQYALEHRVAKGQTLGAIARRYRTNIAAIQAANGLRSAHRLRVGQVLRIPVGAGTLSKPAPVTVAKTTPGRPAISKKPDYVRHRVRRGQTVAAIARRYGTTVEAIVAVNELRSPHRIRPGQVLKIPSS